MPTILEATAAKYPSTYKGNKIYPLEGSSMIPLYENGNWQEHELMFWEHESNCTLRMGNYKAIQRYDTKQWELYDLSCDRSDLNDISSNMHDKLKIMTDKWYELAEKYYVTPKPDDWKY